MAEEDSDVLTNEERRRRYDDRVTCRACTRAIFSLVFLFLWVLVAILFRPLLGRFLSEAMIQVGYNVIGLTMGLLLCLVNDALRELYKV